MMATTTTTEELPKVTLYWLNQSRAQRIIWLLEELKVPYDVELFHRDKETSLAPPELTRIHPLGKSPIISIAPPGGAGQEPILLAESGHMTQYLCDHLPEGKRLVPTRWRDGMEGKLGGETEAFMRYQYILHYCEGSLMPLLVMSVVVGRLKSPAVPFLVRPITSIAANRIFSTFVYPGMRKHMAMLDDMLATAPDGGGYLCGGSLTAADILMSFPLLASRGGRLQDIGHWEGGCWTSEFPRVAAYAERLESEEGYKRSVRKVEELDGKFEATL